MKHLIYIFTIVVLASCSRPAGITKFYPKQKVDNQSSTAFFKFKNQSEYCLMVFINQTDSVQVAPRTVYKTTFPPGPYQFDVVCESPLIDTLQTEIEDFNYKSRNTFKYRLRKPIPNFFNNLFK